jgi:ABC-type multidrug transport system ATPase subunit
VQALELAGVTKSFGETRALSNATLSVAESECFVLLARNGEGKSTCLKLILGLLEPDSGEIWLKGQNPRDNRKELLHAIGAIVDYPRLYPNLTALEFLTVCANLKGIFDRAEIERVLRFVELKGASGRVIENYSLGMKQRLALAAALLGNPKMLVLDEPLNGLDAQGTEEMVSLIVRLREQREHTIILTMHQLDQVARVADKVAVFSKGKTVYCGPLPSVDCARVVFEVDDVPAFISKMVELGHENQYKITGPETVEAAALQRADIANLISHAVRRGVSIYGIETQADSIHDWFVRVTQ